MCRPDSESLTPVFFRADFSDIPDPPSGIGAGLGTKSSTHSNASGLVWPPSTSDDLQHRARYLSAYLRAENTSEPGSVPEYTNP